MPGSSKLLDYNVLVELVMVAEFASRLEAEAVGHALDQYGIFFYVRSEDLGIFGPGHTGATPQGASLWVRSEEEERVRELLSCFYSEPESSEEPS